MKSNKIVVILILLSISFSLFLLPNVDATWQAGQASGYKWQNTFDFYKTFTAGELNVSLEYKGQSSMMYYVEYLGQVNNVSLFYYKGGTYSTANFHGEYQYNDTVLSLNETINKLDASFYGYFGLKYYKNGFEGYVLVNQTIFFKGDLSFTGVATLTLFKEFVSKEFKSEISINTNYNEMFNLNYGAGIPLISSSMRNGIYPFYSTVTTTGQVNGDLSISVTGNVSWLNYKSVSETLNRTVDETTPVSGVFSIDNGNVTRAGFIEYIPRFGTDMVLRARGETILATPMKSTYHPNSMFYSSSTFISNYSNFNSPHPSMFVQGVPTNTTSSPATVSEVDSYLSNKAGNPILDWIWFVVVGLIVAVAVTLLFFVMRVRRPVPIEDANLKPEGRVENITSSCPYCGFTSVVPSRFEHKSVKCPVCQNVYVLERTRSKL